MFVATAMIKYGKKFKCKPCHASYRFCRDNMSEWDELNQEQKRKAIVANRTESQRGKARKLNATHKVRIPYFILDHWGGNLFVQHLRLKTCCVVIVSVT